MLKSTHSKILTQLSLLIFLSAISITNSSATIVQYNIAGSLNISDYWAESSSWWESGPDTYQINLSIDTTNSTLTSTQTPRYPDGFVYNNIYHVPEGNIDMTVLWNNESFNFSFTEFRATSITSLSEISRVSFMTNNMLNTELVNNSLGWLTDSFLSFSNINANSHSSINDAISFIGTADTVSFNLGGCPSWTTLSATDAMCYGSAEEWDGENLN